MTQKYQINEYFITIENENTTEESTQNTSIKPTGKEVIENKIKDSKQNIIAFLFLSLILLISFICMI